MKLLAGGFQIPAHCRWTALIHSAHTDSTHASNRMGPCRSTLWEVGHLKCSCHCVGLTPFLYFYSFCLICSLGRCFGCCCNCSFLVHASFFKDGEKCKYQDLAQILFKRTNTVKGRLCIQPQFKLWREVASHWQGVPVAVCSR